MTCSLKCPRCRPRTLLDRWWRAETEDGPVLYDSAAEARTAKGRIGRVVCVSRYRVKAKKP